MVTHPEAPQARCCHPCGIWNVTSPPPNCRVSPGRACRAAHPRHRETTATPVITVTTTPAMIHPRRKRTRGIQPRPQRLRDVGHGSISLEEFDQRAGMPEMPCAPWVSGDRSRPFVTAGGTGSGHVWGTNDLYWRAADWAAVRRAGPGDMIGSHAGPSVRVLLVAFGLHPGR